MVSAIFVVRYGGVRDAERGYDVPPLCLLKDRSEVWEGGEVGELGQSVGTYDGVEFFLGFLLHFGMHGHS